MSIKLVVKFSDTMVLPAYLPTPGTQSGTWLQSIDGNAYATAPGNRCGITGGWTVVGADDINEDLIDQGFSQIVGSALVDGQALWIHKATPATVSFSKFGVLKGITPVRTVIYQNNHWSLLKEVEKATTKVAQVQLSLLEVPNVRP